MNYNKKKIYGISFLTVLFIIIFIPCILNFLISKIHWGIANNQTWLLFWATWFGGIIGGMVTLIGLGITLHESRKRE